MRRNIRFLVVAFCLCAAGNNASGQTVIDSGYCGAQGANLAWVLTSDNVLTISGSGTMADYTTNTAPWGGLLYGYRDSIHTVVIGTNVTSIGNYAFYECYYLISVTIPNGITTIGEGAFFRCPQLTSVTIPNSVTTIGDGAFYGCGITSVIIPNNITSIGNGVFWDCYNLTSVIIPN